MKIKKARSPLQYNGSQFAGRQNVKMVSFDVVTGWFDVISNSKRVIVYQKGYEIFRFPVVKSSFLFPNVKIIIVPATSLINDFR